MLKGFAAHPEFINRKGRPKGVISERTRLFNELKGYMKNGGLQRYLEGLDKLPGPEYVQIFTKLMEFVLPKQARITTTIDGPAPTIIEIVDNVKADSNERLPQEPEESKED